MNYVDFLLESAKKGYSYFCYIVDNDYNLDSKETYIEDEEIYHIAVTYFDNDFEEFLGTFCFDEDENFIERI